MIETQRNCLKPFGEIKMKKSLIALSVLAAVAGTAQAQSSVTVYGVLDMALQNENNGAFLKVKVRLHHWTVVFNLVPVWVSKVVKIWVTA
jgi:hypothetical protein